MPAEPKGSRVESWKGIAAFFQRDERTVKRWERERGMPVHRMPGERGGVFAYSEELNVWLNSGWEQRKAAAVQAEMAVAEPESRSGDLVTAGRSGERVAAGELVAAGGAGERLAGGLGRSPVGSLGRELEREVAIAEPAVFRPDASEVAAPTPVAASGPGAAKLATGSGWMRRAWVAGAALLLLGAGVLVWQRGHGQAAEGSEKREEAAESVANPQARELYLSGKYLWNHRTEASLNQAVDAFTRAIALDPGYAPAYAGLAETYELLPQYGAMTLKDALPRAASAARKAIELDDSLAEAHRALGRALFYGTWDTRGAIAEYQRAIELKPEDAEAHHWYGNCLLTVHRLEEAGKEMEMARRLDPSSRSIELDYGTYLYYARGHEVGLAKILEVEHTEPDFLGPPRYLELLYLQQGEVEQYLAQARLAATISHDAAEQRVVGAAEAGWSASGYKGMLESLRAAQKSELDAGRGTAFDLGMTCVMLGRLAEADMYFEAALRKRNPGAMSLASDPFFDRLQGDVGFQQVKRQVEELLQAE